MLKIYGVARSRAFRVLWMAQELGLDYQHVKVDFASGETREPGFLALNPNGQVPVIDDDGFILWESMAINLYLAKKYGAGEFYPTRLEDPWYDADHGVRRVRGSGEIRWGGDLVFISEVLVGEPVGIAETEDGDWIVRFADVDLGVIDRRSKKLRRFTAPRPGRRKAEQTEKSVTHVSGPKCYL